MRRAWLAVPLVSTLAGCGDLPMPFKDNPGSEAALLAAPPPARLAVPTPNEALLADDGARLLARDVATALDDQQIPAEAVTPARGDWRVQLAAAISGTQVTPRYTLLTPKGAIRASAPGTPVPQAAWANADPATLSRVANEAATEIVAMLTGIQASERKADPKSLLNRPARIDFAGVTGASGDGDAALTHALRTQLVGKGDIVVDASKGADFTVAATVGMATPKDGQQAIEIDWHVLDAKGQEAGNVTQLNGVPAHSLDLFWGDVATAAATEAASGIQRVIDNNSGRNDQPLPAPGASAHPHETGAPAPQRRVKATVPVPMVPGAAKAAPTPAPPQDTPAPPHETNPSPIPI